MEDAQAATSTVRLRKDETILTGRFFTEIFMQKCRLSGRAGLPGPGFPASRLIRKPAERRLQAFARGAENDVEPEVGAGAYSS